MKDNDVKDSDIERAMTLILPKIITAIGTRTLLTQN